jgi:hypothetical protein
LRYTLVVSVVPIWVNAFEMAVLSEFMLAIAPRPMSAATMAYSIKSWPDSSCKSVASSVLITFLFFLLKLMGVKPAPMLMRLSIHRVTNNDTIA